VQPPPVQPPPVQPLPPVPSLAAPTVGSLLAGTAAAPSPVTPEPPPAAARPMVRATASEIVDLLWLDPKAPDRARLEPRWQELIARLRPQPPAIEADDDPPEDPPEVVDRRDVVGVLAEADPTPLEDLDLAIEEATSPSGVFTPPLALVTGELALTFDPIESLKAALAAIAPFAAGPDKKLKEAFDAAAQGLDSPWTRESPRAAEALSARLAEAFPHGAWSLPPGWLDQQVERAVVEKRAYQRRKVFGKTWIRALLVQRGGASVPVFLPDDLADELPLYARFSARLLTEVQLQQDQYETHPYALRTLALARVTTPPRPAPRGATRSRPS
jgi:hypothetical protein